MQRLNLLGSVFFVVVALSGPALADQPARTPEWWEIATGIAAVPAAIVGIVTAYYTAVKSRLEARKLELDLRSQEAALSSTTSARTASETPAANPLLSPLIDRTKIDYFMLRFVLLYLMVEFWQILNQVLGFVLGGAYMTMTQYFHVGSSSPALQIVLFGMTEVAKFGWIAVVLLVGLPLYKDIAKHIGFRFSFRRPNAEA